MKTIFCLVAVCDGIGKARTWGWYPTKEAAEADIRAANDCIFEQSSYRYAVIEEVGPGFMGDAGERATWWYEAARNPDDTYTITPLQQAPEPHAMIVNWAMG